MKYKLVNRITNEEHLCNKVTIDGWDYYYIDEVIPYNPDGGTNGKFVCLSEIISNQDYGVKLGDEQYISPFIENVGSCGGCRTIVATNNHTHTMELPKIIDELHELANTCRQQGSIIQHPDPNTNVFESGVYQGYRIGYKKSQHTHPFSEEDMIDFALYVACVPDTPYISVKDLLITWIEQRIKTIYYEDTNSQGNPR